MKLFIILRRFYRLLIKGLSSGSNSSIYLQEGHHEGIPAAASPEGWTAAYGTATPRYRFLKYLAMGSWT
jgi:hypothetical protein